MENYQGVKLGKQNSDFIAGVSSPLIDNNINLSGNWESNLPEHELQNKGFETYGCSFFTGLDCLETLFMFYLKNNLIPKGHVKWLQDNGYFKNGFINFSDRNVGMYSDVEIGKGTYLYKANDSIRKHLIPEDLLPYKNYFYYDKDFITTEIKNLELEFQKRFIINWRWEEVTEQGLKKSPLQSIVRYANGDGILKPFGDFNHSVMVYKEDNERYFIDDNYNQRFKEYGKDYVIDFVSFSITIINNINMNTEKFLTDNDLKFVRNSNTGAFGRILQRKLRVIDSKDRGVLLLLDNEHRKNGVTINNEEWEALPKLNF